MQTPYETTPTLAALIFCPKTRWQIQQLCSRAHGYMTKRWARSLGKVVGQYFSLGNTF